LDAIRSLLGDPYPDAPAWSAVDAWVSSNYRTDVSRAAIVAFGRLADDAGAGFRGATACAFWEACLQRGLLRFARLLLPPNKTVPNTTRSKIAPAIATLSGSSLFHSQQAGLMVDVAGLIAVDWTASGLIRLWDPDVAEVPKISETTFTASQIRAPLLRFGSQPGVREFYHINGLGGWQSQIAAILANRAGIYLLPSQYSVIPPGRSG